MTYENMTPLGPDNKYTRFLTEKFNIRPEQIIKAETGKVRCFRLGKPEMVNMVVIEVKGSDNILLHEAHSEMVRKFFKNSGTLLNLQYFERANREGIATHARAPQPQELMREDEPDFPMDLVPA